MRRARRTVNAQSGYSQIADGLTSRHCEEKHIVAAHVDLDAYRDFKLLAAEQLKSTDAMVHEAIALLFQKYHRPVPAAIKHKLQTLGMKRQKLGIE